MKCPLVAPAERLLLSPLRPPRGTSKAPWAADPEKEQEVRNLMALIFKNNEGSQAWQDGEVSWHEMQIMYRTAMEVKALMKIFGKNARDSDGDGDVDEPFTKMARKAFRRAAEALSPKEKADLGMQPMARPVKIFECFDEVEDLRSWLNPLNEKDRVVPLNEEAKSKEVKIGRGAKAKKERKIYIDAEALHDYRNKWVARELLRRQHEADVEVEMGKDVLTTYPENDPMVNPSYVGWIDLLRFFESKMNFLHKATLSKYQIGVLRARERKQKMSAKKVRRTVHVKQLLGARHSFSKSLPRFSSRCIRRLCASLCQWFSRNPRSGSPSSSPRLWRMWVRLLFNVCSIGKRLRKSRQRPISKMRER